VSELNHTQIQMSSNSEPFEEQRIRIAPIQSNWRILKGLNLISFFEESKRTHTKKKTKEPPTLSSTTLKIKENSNTQMRYSSLD